MKAKLEQLPLESESVSYLCYHVDVPRFDFLWHYHPEYELTYIVRGKGKRFVGDSYEDYAPGDLALLGSMLPHTWASAADYHQGCEAIVVQFSKGFAESLCQYPEMSDICKLLINAKSGLVFQKADMAIAPLLNDLITHKGANAFAVLITLLQLLSGMQAKPLSSDHFKPLKGNENQQRINKVFSYIQKNYTGKVSLKRASAIVHLSESAFCKFFKRVTGRTFSDYVNEMRISKACELLIETDKPIELVALETGFESQTYFNRVFLRKKAVSPKTYRRNHLYLQPHSKVLPAF